MVDTNNDTKNIIYQHQPQTNNHIITKTDKTKKQQKKTKQNKTNKKTNNQANNM